MSAGRGVASIKNSLKKLRGYLSFFFFGSKIRYAICVKGKQAYWSETLVGVDLKGEGRRE